MASCCSGFCDTAGSQFTAKRARRDLDKYRKSGPGQTTRLLRDGVATPDLNGGLLLDIGSGVGALAFELLDRGVVRAVVVDASSAFLAAVEEEARRRGRLEVVELVHGDFLNVAADLPTANVVTLDRVVCCYPHVEALLETALRHSHDLFAFSYPRDVWHVRVALALENGLRRIRRNPFRTFVHAPAVMERIVTRSGFSLRRRRKTGMWSVDVYGRGASERDSANQ
jgi:magnesium-protoporphyrin O-methyltransferase